jgi:ComF family protein
LKSEYAGTCGACLKDEPPFSRIVSFGLHEGALKSAVNFLKFYSARGLAKDLGEMVAGLDIPRVDCIVAVPLSAKGLRTRGFNQTLLIGRTLSKKLGIPLELGLLEKVKDTLPQVGLNRKERVKNIKGAFGVSRKLGGEKVLLLDDVVTTTTTARECSKALLKAGAGEVAVASVSRARGM